MDKDRLMGGCDSIREGDARGVLRDSMSLESHGIFLNQFVTNHLILL